MRRVFTIGRLGILAMILLAHLGSNKVFASEEEPIQLDSVVVSAQKFRTDKQDVPSNISVVDSKTMQDSGVDNLEGLSALAPNIGISKIDTYSTQVVFRGIGGMANMNKVWNINMDGVAIPYVGLDTFLDVDRVEFLRGSQGALYGRNTHAGAVNIVTKDPGSSANGNVTLNYESFNTLKARAAAGSPINDVASYRMAVAYKRSDGYFHNEYYDKNDTNRNEQFTARGKVLLQADDKSKLTLGMYADKYESAFDSYGPANGDVTLNTENNRRGHNDGYLLSPTLTWEKDFGAVNVTSISNYSRSNYNYLQD